MTDSLTSSATRPPTFLSIVKGIWLLTWKSRLSLRRLPGIIIPMLILPVLMSVILFFHKKHGGDSSAEPFQGIFIHLYFLKIIPMVCLVICGAMIRDEIQSDTLGFLITRPLTRSRLFIAKYLSNMAWLQIILVAESFLFFVVGLVFGVSEMLSTIPIILGTQILSVMVWSALSSLFGLLTKNYIVWGLMYGFLVEVGIGKIPTNVNTLSMTVNIKRLFANSYVGEFNGWPVENTSVAVMAMIIAPVILLTASAALFTWKEYLHSNEFQK